MKGFFRAEIPSLLVQRLGIPRRKIFCERKGRNIFGAETSAHIIFQDTPNFALHLILIFLWKLTKLKH